MSNVHYGIDAVARLTGLSQEVLRAWENRYGLVSPKRSPKGRRQYSDADVARLQRCASALEMGYRIGDVARLPDEHMERLLAGSEGPGPEHGLEFAMQLIARLDHHEFARQLDNQALALGPLEFCRWCAELLRMIGSRWECGKLAMASEHWATVQIKGVLLCLLRFGRDRPTGSPMCFATLPGEPHELGTLMAAVCAHDVGALVSYLGPDLPIDELAKAAKATKSDVVAVGAVTVPRHDALEHLVLLRASLPRRIDVWVGGVAANDQELPPGVRLIGDFDALRHHAIRTLARN